MASVTYSKQFPLGANEFETISITLGIPSDSTPPLETFGEAKRFVEKSHNYFVQLPKYQNNKLIVANPEQYAPVVVTEAQAFITEFEADYADFIAEFPPEGYTKITG